ncbi:MAG: hypothetical protein Q4C13_06880, partial [Clostridia bacterium]|nr:hypothetical protein [Clostridia bacterium]
MENARYEMHRFALAAASITDNAQFEAARMETAAALAACVHAITDCYVRKKEALGEGDREYLRSFVYLSNCFRHDKRCNEVYQEVCGCSFPLQFPMQFGPPAL